VKIGRLLLTLAVIVAGGLLLSLWWEARLEQSQDEPIRAAARRYGVDPALVKAVVWRESRFNPHARGTHEELGLMQLRETAAQEWADAERIEAFSHEHCIDPRTNTLAGTFYLAKLLKRYARTDNPVPYALADFNAGRGNVLKWTTGAAATKSAVFMDQIGFPSTRAYVKAVQRRRFLYALLMRFGS